MSIHLRYDLHFETQVGLKREGSRALTISSDFLSFFAVFYLNKSIHAKLSDGKSTMNVGWMTEEGEAPSQPGAAKSSRRLAKHPNNPSIVFYAL